MSGAKCPICGKATAHEHRPFCSRRCADIDLQRWFSDRYVLPESDDAEAPPDEGDES
jgi:endogenous inhibitor of DNA gyrase (YacG/DUF329 family)